MSKTPRSTIAVRRGLPKAGEKLHLALTVKAVRGTNTDDRASITLEIPGFVGRVVTVDADALLDTAAVED